MSVFEPVTLGWDGKEYTIPSDRILGAIARIEEHITLAEINNDGVNRKTIRMVPVARAYASVLRYAGADAKDDDVYESMFMTGNTSNVMADALTMLMGMMVPPKKMNELSTAAPKKTPSTEEKKSSSKHSKSHADPSSGEGGD